MVDFQASKTSLTCRSDSEFPVVFFFGLPNSGTSQMQRSCSHVNCSDEGDLLGVVATSRGPTFLAPNFGSFLVSGTPPKLAVGEIWYFGQISDLCTYQLLVGYEFRMTLKHIQKAGPFMQTEISWTFMIFEVPGRDESGTEQRSKFGLYGWSTTQLQKD